MKLISNGKVSVNISRVNYLSCESFGSVHEIYFVFGELKPNLENQVTWEFETEDAMKSTYEKILKLCGSTEV